jgi:signal transduction histidine kinase
MQAQEQLRVETARAENSGRSKAAFLANMTHEIRTPLNAIVGFSDLLPMIDNAGEKQELIRIIHNNCDMLLRLINDILEASDIESRPIAIEPVDVDIARAFDDICQTLEQRVQEPGVEFIKDNPYTTFQTHLDTGRIQQVITNFVINAVKYTHQGHIRVGYLATGNASPSLFTLHAPLPEEQGVFIYCEDTGAGIPKDKQSAVFERFVKLNEFVQGTGLGLSICKAIADRCGGRIGVSSEGEGHGSTFWIWIPCDYHLSPNTNH